MITKLARNAVEFWIRWNLARSRPAVNSTIVGEKFAGIWNGRTVCLKFAYAAYILNARDEKVSDENSNLRLISLIIIPFFSDRVSFVKCARKRVGSKSLNLYSIRRIRIWPCKKSRVSRLGEERFRHRLDQ